MRAGLLGELEAYYDAVPRSSARAEQIGPFTLFVHKAAAGWSYYARPSLGATQFVAEEAQRGRARQRELGIPRGGAVGVWLTWCGGGPGGGCGRSGACRQS